MIDRKRIDAVVLAGGRARRMGGVDKGLIEIGGRTMIARTLAAVAPQVGRVVISANRSFERYREFGVPVVADRQPGFAGPLAGLDAGFAATGGELLLSVPCDAPLLPPDLVERLADALERSGNDIAVAEAGDRLHSLHALFRRSLAADLAAALAAGERKPDRWYASRGFARVAFDDAPDAFVNVNTPDQLEQLEARLTMEIP